MVPLYVFLPPKQSRNKYCYIPLSYYSSNVLKWIKLFAIQELTWRIRDFDLAEERNEGRRKTQHLQAHIVPSDLGSLTTLSFRFLMFKMRITAIPISKCSVRTEWADLFRKASIMPDRQDLWVAVSTIIITATTITTQSFSVTSS